ncbi:hypothetical protein [Actinomadura sp. WMMB 499]|uniref:hypothetical protein n=1 Tax=Actinomadura sp. WMMB 499 TaxID=1219491 RepID=UPI001243C82A|nr:hypothetical protein [Actinomadura sp. WMMB 499]QFG23966.1 hypothetical protein F7P10_25420 [Actinomadura sp. WMMB 499]
MTERSPGAPNPAEPARPHDVPAAGHGPSAPTDLSAVRRTDAIIDAMAARRAAGSAEPGDPDPAVRLLNALISDIEEPAPPVPAGPGPRRRGPRTIVALGVAGAVLASTGVAAAGSGVTDRSSAVAPTTPGPSGPSGPPADADDSVAATHAKPAPPAPRRSEPARPSAPVPAASPAPGREREAPEHIERAFRERLERLLAEAREDGRLDGRPDGPPDGPTPMPPMSATGRDDDSEPSPTLEDLRDEARERWNRLARPD